MMFYEVLEENRVLFDESTFSRIGWFSGYEITQTVSWNGECGCNFGYAYSPPSDSEG